MLAGMKGLSVLFTLMLLLLVHYLAQRLQQAEALPRQNRHEAPVTLVTPGSANAGLALGPEGVVRL